MTTLERQMDLMLEVEEVKKALRLCMNELFSIHLQYGNKENAIKHSIALKEGMKILKEEYED